MRAVRDGWHRYLDERGGETPEVHDLATALAEGGRSIVAIGSESHVCGLVALADAVRPEVRGALQALRAAGVTRLVMVTGDNRETADRIGKALGVDEVVAELLPEDKVAAVDALGARHGAVAMIGDGVNDAPAMARATVGIAMGAVGTDAAIETADLAPMADDLSRLPWLIEHSRRMLSIVRQNVVLALGVKTVFAALALAGVATLWSAIAADMGASLLVVFNGLRMLQGEPALAAPPAPGSRSPRSETEPCTPARPLLPRTVALDCAEFPADSGSCSSGQGGLRSERGPYPGRVPGAPDVRLRGEPPRAVTDGEWFPRTPPRSRTTGRCRIRRGG